MNKTILILTCWLLGLLSGMAQQRKMTDVQHIADSILNIPTRWGNQIRAKKVKTHRIISASKLVDNQQDAFYVCDAGVDGFAVISADERMTPVLGFSQNRTFDTDYIPIGMQELMNSYAKEYEALTSGKPLRLTRRNIEGIQEQVGPLLTTEWGQATPFNNRCPEWQGERCITGCVAVTTAQTMRYYQYPDSAKGEIELCLCRSSKNELWPERKFCQQHLPSERTGKELRLRPGHCQHPKRLYDYQRVADADAERTERRKSTPHHLCSRITCGRRTLLYH